VKIKFKFDIVKKIFNYFKDVVSEFALINWPAKKEIAYYLIAILILSAIITGYIYGLDNLFSKLQLYWITRVK